MANVHFYIGMLNLGLNASQKSTFINAIQGEGTANNGNAPQWRNHWRLRTDNEAVIFEGLFNEDNFTVAAIKARLANIFGVAVGTISHSIQDTIYGKSITFTHSSVDRIRMIAFGMNAAGQWGTIAQSRAAVQAYLAANAGQWGENAE